jgi:NAD(P)-dependent dehydrogenase (short-subunit alcohol dehydrogenase family)
MDLQLTGNRGIGYAVAEALAAEGASVALVARGQTALDEARGRLTEAGHQAIAVAADTNDDTAVRAMTAQVAGELGGIDILVNAAAEPATPTAGRARLADLDDDDLRREVETKVLGYLRCARAAAPHMAAQGWGRIINISGLAARQSGSTFGSIRNVAVAAMTKNLADELGPDGINVTVVHPGMTITERTPATLTAMATASGSTETEAQASLAARTSIGRLVTAAEVADVVAFLASPRSVAITGDAVAAGGGARHAIHY